MGPRNEFGEFMERLFGRGDNELSQRQREVVGSELRNMLTRDVTWAIHGLVAQRVLPETELNDAQKLVALFDVGLSYDEAAAHLEMDPDELEFRMQHVWRRLYEAGVLDRPDDGPTGDREPRRLLPSFDSDAAGQIHPKSHGD